MSKVFSLEMLELLRHLVESNCVLVMVKSFKKGTYALKKDKYMMKGESSVQRIKRMNPVYLSKFSIHSSTADKSRTSTTGNHGPTKYHTMLVL